MDLSSLLLLNLSVAASHGGVDLHSGCYNVISLSSAILTAGEMYKGEGVSLVSAEFEHKHTDTHPLTQRCLLWLPSVTMLSYTSL